MSSLEVTIDKAFKTGLKQGKKEAFISILQEISQGKNLQYLELYVKIHLDILKQEENNELYLWK